MGRFAIYSNVRTPIGGQPEYEGAYAAFYGSVRAKDPFGVTTIFDGGKFEYAKNFGAYADVTGFKAFDSDGHILLELSGINIPRKFYNYGVNAFQIYNLIYDSMSITGPQSGGIIFGFRGNDDITGSDKIDEIEVLGQDTVHAGKGNDIISGSFADFESGITGGRVYGGEGFDTLNAGSISKIETVSGETVWTSEHGLTRNYPLYQSSLNLTLGIPKVRRI